MRLLLLFLILLAALLYFGDRVGWEGDDISQLEGIVNYQYKGAAGVYNYYWQPLAYELNLLVYRLVGDPRVLFLTPQIVGAAAITLLAWSVYLFCDRKLRLLLVVALLLLIPELFFCALYYNSTVFAMLPMAVALVMLFHREDSPLPDEVRYAAVGACSTLAVLFRIEFLLTLPMVWYLLVFVAKAGRRDLTWAASASLIVAGVALATGILAPFHILQTVTSYGTAEWLEALKSPAVSLKVSFTAMNVTVWAALLAALAYLLVTRIRDGRWRSLLVLIPVAVLLVPFTRPIFSPKYLIPAAIFVPFALAKVALELREHLGEPRFGKLSWAAIALSFLLQVVSVEPAMAFPYVDVTTQPTFVGNADGTRPLGAYLRGYERVRRQLGDVRFDGGGVKFSSTLADMIVACNRDATILYLKSKDNQAIDSWWWPWPAFYLQLEGFRVVEYRPKDEIVLGHGRQTVRLKIVGEEEFESFDDDGLLVRVYVKYDESYEEKTEALLDAVRRECGAE